MARKKTKVETKNSELEIAELEPVELPEIKGEPEGVKAEPEKVKAESQVVTAETETVQGESEAEPNAGTEAKSEPEATGTEPEAIRTEPETRPEAEATKSETDTNPVMEAKSETGSNSETKSEPATDAKSEPAAETKPEAIAAAKSEPAAAAKEFADREFEEPAEVTEFAQDTAEDGKNQKEAKTQKKSKTQKEAKPQKETKSGAADAKAETDREKTDSQKESELPQAEEKEEKKPGKARRVFRVIGRIFAFVGVTLGMAVVCLYFVMLVLTHGPSKEMRDLFVLSVRESSAGGFLASMYLSKDEIAEIEAKNTVIETDDTTDTSIVTIAAKEDKPEAEEGSEPSFIVKTNFDVEVYEENGIEFHRIQGPTFTGIMMVVADPDRVFVGTPYEAYDGRPGLDVPTICDRYDAIAAINGAFFVDTNGVGDGGTPLGFVFSEGNRLYGGLGETYNMMGFNEDGVLICGKMTGQEAVDKGIRDGVSCNPFLVINGEGMNVAGSGGGLNPRTALGQRADGAVLLLAVDGRQASSLGATMSDMVDVMLAFGAVNAGNLDGGGSTVCYYDKKVMNVVMSIYGTRGVPDAFCVRKEEK